MGLAVLNAPSSQNCPFKAACFTVVSLSCPLSRIAQCPRSRAPSLWFLQNHKREPRNAHHTGQLGRILAEHPRSRVLPMKPGSWVLGEGLLVG